MCKLGGTEKSHGKAPVLIIHLFATFLKFPLEVHDAKKGSEGTQERCEQKIDSFSCRLGVAKWFGPLFRNVLPASTFLPNHVKDQEKMEKSLRRYQMASVMHTCAGLVGLESEDVEFSWVFEVLLEGPHHRMLG